MIISRTPYRLSFFGGGTDYPAWYRKHGGSVLTATIDKYCYLSVRYLPPFFEHRFRIVYSHIERCQKIDEISHPAVRAVLQHLQVDRGVEVHHDGDLPARSGMGTSSSFTVGLLHAMYALKGGMTDKRRLAQESIHLEQEVLKETVGSQDQVSVAFGGVNHLVFTSDGDFSVRPITLRPERLQELNAHLMLFYTGIMRTASKVAESYVNHLDDRKRQLRIMSEMVQEAISILNDGAEIHRFGELLDEGWQIKRSLSAAVTNAEVEEMYEEARAGGAVGGKLTGAGGGGFMLLFVPPSRQAQVKARLKGLIQVPFKFESTGSHIVFYDPENDYSAVEAGREAEIRPFRELDRLAAQP